MKPLLVLDLDGTLADCSHRLHLAKNKQWDGFHHPDLVAKDEPIEEARDALPSLLRQAERILILTGRPTTTERVTKHWLKEHFPFVKYDRLVLKPAGSVEKAHTFKPRTIKTFMTESYQPVICVDDQEDNLAVFAAEGWLAFRAPEIWHALV